MGVGPPLLDGLLRSELGSHATFSEVTATDDTVLGLAASTAEHLSGSPRRVIWVENGPATMFSLQQPGPGAAVVSERAVHYSSRIRNVILNKAASDQVYRDAVQIFLGIAAEEALQQGHTDLALKTLSKSILGWRVGGEGPTPNAVREGRTGELVVWCYGLLHELGHLSPEWTYGHLTGDDAILGRLDWAFRDWLQEPKVIPDARKWSLSRTNSVIGIEELRSEVHADLFATEALLQAARTLSDEAGQRFDWDEFICEQSAAQQAVVAFHRLQRALHLGASPAPSGDKVIEAMLQPLATAVRNLSQQECIVMARLMEAIAAGRTPSGAEVELERELVHRCLRVLAPQYEIIDHALDATSDFILNEQQHTDQRALIEQAAAVAKQSRHAAEYIARFLALAESLGRSTTQIEGLRELTSLPVSGRRSELRH